MCPPKCFYQIAIAAPSTNHSLLSSALGMVLETPHAGPYDRPVNIPLFSYSKNLLLDENGTAVAKDKWSAAQSY